MKLRTVSIFLIGIGFILLGFREKWRGKSDMTKGTSAGAKPAKDISLPECPYDTTCSFTTNKDGQPTVITFVKTNPDLIPAFQMMRTDAVLLCRDLGQYPKVAKLWRIDSKRCHRILATELEIESGGAPK